METPKEKAEKLFARFQNIETERYPLGMDDDDAYECSKIAVNELIEECKSFGYWHQNVSEKRVKHYEEVLNELNKL